MVPFTLIVMSKLNYECSLLWKEVVSRFGKGFIVNIIGTTAYISWFKNGNVNSFYTDLSYVTFVDKEAKEIAEEFLLETRVKALERRNSALEKEKEAITSTLIKTKNDLWKKKNSKQARGSFLKGLRQLLNLTFSKISFMGKKVLRFILMRKN